MNIYYVEGKFCVGKSRREIGWNKKAMFLAGWKTRRREVKQENGTLTLGPLQIKFFDLPKPNFNVNLYWVRGRLVVAHNRREIRQRFGLKGARFLLGFQWDRFKYRVNTEDDAKVLGPLQIGRST